MDQKTQMVVRLPQALVDRIDAAGERLRQEQPGPFWKRSEVVRLLLEQALAAYEKPAKRTRR